MMATGVVLSGSTPASAHKAEHVSVTSAVTPRPPILLKPRFTCDGDGAGLTVRLRNRTRTEEAYEVRVSRGDYQEALPIYLPPRGVGSVEFAGMTAHGRYVIEVLNVVGDYVLRTRVKVRCRS
jgi:hypothetical protein